MANICISAVCNRGCDYCFTADHLRGSQEAGGDPAARFLPAAAFEERLAFLSRSGMREVRLLGGEPTLHPEFPALVARARAHGLAVVVFSNGLMPEGALACLQGLPADGCSVLVNVEPPPPLGNGDTFRRQRDTLLRLGPRAFPGLNLHRTDLDPGFLLDLVAGTGCRPTVRLGLAHPCLSGANRYVTPNQYRAIGARIGRLAGDAAAAGVCISLDCGFVRCMFSDPELDLLRGAGANLDWRCSPILDVDLGGRAIHCFPLSGLGALPLTPQADAQALRRDLSARTRAYRQAGVFKECSACGFRQQGACSGGCLATTIRRFRRTPFELQVGAAAGARRAGTC